MTVIVRTDQPTSGQTGQGSATRLNGTLEDGSLADLVQFLHHLRRTGHLVIERSDPPQSASVYVIDGRVVHAWCPPLSGEECFYALLGWREGRFLFLGGGAPERRTIASEPGALLLEGMRRADEMQRILAELPAPATVLHRNHDRDVLGREPLTIDEWRLYQQVDGRRTVRDLVEVVGRHHPDAALCLLRLLRLEVVRTIADHGFLSAIVLRRCDDGAAAPSSPTAVAILARADGRYSLSDVAELAACQDQDLIDATRDLIAAGAVEVIAGEEEYRQFIG